MIEIKCKLIHFDAKIPTKAYEGDAGFDLYAVEDVCIPFERNIEVKTGICFEIPPEYVGILFARSSYGKKGITIHHGIIDCEYRGEIILYIRNTFRDEKNYAIPEIVIKRGDKIAQIVFIPIPKVNLIQVDNLSESDRGEKGFGSSDK